MEVKTDQECLIKGNKTKTDKFSGYFHSFPEQIRKLQYGALKFRKCVARLYTKSLLLFPRQT